MYVLCFVSFFWVGLENCCLEDCGVLAPLPPCARALHSPSTLEGRVWVAAAHRVVMDTLCVRLGLIRGLTLLSRHHSPSLSIVDEFNCLHFHSLGQSPPCKAKETAVIQARKTTKYNPFSQSGPAAKLVGH